MKLQPMHLVHVDEVIAVEQASYAFAWTRGHMMDSLRAGHWAQILRDDSDTLIGYIVAMPGVQEMHLLNITVASAFRRQGHATRLMHALFEQGWQLEAKTLWLEVRPSNLEGLQLYRHLGFEQQGVRRAYYPAAHSGREDAWVLSLNLDRARASRAA